MEAVMPANTAVPSPATLTIAHVNQPLLEILPREKPANQLASRASRNERRPGNDARISVSIADTRDRERIYALRHEVYAAELGQHQENAAGLLSDQLDFVNTYLVAKIGSAIAGFVAITPPSEAGYSIDKYFAREDLPLVFDDGLYEIRLLTVTPEWRGSRAAPLLMYAAFRYVESVGGTSIICIGRLEMMEMYKRAGLRSLGSRTQSGRVTYELMTMESGDDHARHHDLLAWLERHADWQIRGVSFRRGGSCYHGGAFFDAIGDEFDRLGAKEDVINADVLDAWFDPAPSVINSLRSHLPWIVRTSPPTGCEGMQRMLAKARGVGPSNILPGAGSSDLIFLGLRHWLDAGSRVLILDPMYGEYAHVLEQVVGCTVDRFALSRSRNYAVNLKELARRLRGGYDWIVLVNPNSPTGQYVGREALETLLADSPRPTRFWIDETYVEYAGNSRSLERFAAASKNVVICKSMSKVYALSGARCAYLCGPPHMMDELRAISPPWSVSLPGQIAACEALRSTSYYEKRWEETHALRDQLAAGLGALGWDVVPGCANFLLCHLPPDQPAAAGLAAECRRRGLFIRDVANMGSCFDARTVRVAVKDWETNKEILERLRVALMEMARAPGRQFSPSFCSSSPNLGSSRIPS
jgi:histidinol-phosphate/aromatic aminotransferase/cobyric acid decarboxylase-like protein